MSDMPAQKIALVIPSLKKRGGLEKYAIRLAQGFVESGNRVEIITAAIDSEVEKTLPCALVLLPSFFSLGLFRILFFEWTLHRHLKKNRYDIVFGMERSLCMQTHHRAGNGVHAAYLDRRRATASWLKKCSFAINPLHRLILYMERKTFDHSKLKKIFVNSEMVRQEVLKYYPRVDPSKVIMIHNGVEWREFEQPFEEGLQRKKLPYQFLFLGNEYMRKGLLLLLQALARLQDMQFTLSVVGRERHLGFFVNEAKKLGLEKQVHFFGPTKNVQQFYQMADCLVVPSLYDPFANVTVEALAMGLYVISSASNGGSEVISEDMGLVFHDLCDPQQLAQCLAKAMQRPKSDASARSIRQRIEQLDFSQQLQKLIHESTVE